MLSITVRVKVGKTTGSGVLIERKGRIYTVVTNRHIINRGKSYQVQTSEGNSYEAKLIALGKKNDLAVLQFNSDRSYEVASISGSLDEQGNKVFAVGFPFNTDKIVLTAGQFSLKPKSPLQHGYQLGYTSQIQAGMSGGAVMDTNGRVIGIHTSAEGERYRLINKLQLGFSLGIPIATFLDSLSAGLLKSPNNNSSETEWVNYGNQLWRSSRYSEAVAAFERAIAQSTNFHQAYYGKGLALSDLGKAPESAAAFQQAIDLKADFYPAWYRQSLSLLNQKKYSAALTSLENAIALKPENKALYALKGEALENLARYNDAIDSYHKAIATDNNPLVLVKNQS